MALNRNVSFRMSDRDPPDARDLFEILVRENSTMLTSYLRCAVRDPTTVDDLFQETFLIAWKNLSRYDRSRPFAPWIRGIATRLILAERRRRTRFITLDENDLSQLDGFFEDFSASPGDTWSEKLDALRQCLDRLRPPLRRVLDLRYEGDLGCQSIAETVGDSLEAVKKRLQRARSALALCLESNLPKGETG